MMGGDLNWELVKDAMCKRPATWKRYKNGGVKSFPAKALTLSSKVGHYFVVAKLIPTTNYSTVMKERAGLVYAIESNRTIDVGLIIHHSILHRVTKDNVGLYHPSIIIDLCKAAGVVWSKGEEIQQPKYIIDDKLLRIM